MILLSGAGKAFCSGIEVNELSSGLAAMGSGCGARNAYAFRAKLGSLQRAVSCMESVRCPTIALVHGACIGAGVDLITACDIRCATAAAKFSVKVRACRCCRPHFCP